MDLDFYLRGYGRMPFSGQNKQNRKKTNCHMFIKQMSRHTMLFTYERY